MKPLPPYLVAMMARQAPPPAARSIWDGPGADQTPVRRGTIRPMDRNVTAFSAAEEIPGPVDEYDVDGSKPILLNTVCPPWHCPPLWSVAIDFPATECIPWYMVKTLMGTLNVPKGYLLVIKGVSYEAANAVQDDVVSFEVAVNGEPRATWEDVVADAVQPNPVHRMALSGHIRELPLHIVVPVNSTVTVSATLMGAIDFNGVSLNWPGQPILTPDCHVKMLFNGWYFPAMNNIQGAPRQAFNGDMENRLLDGGL
jgi:hypothetical protein